MRIVLHGEASAELEQAVDWYENAQSGLGEELQGEIESALAIMRSVR
jgi:hypothetical protein